MERLYLYLTKKELTGCKEHLESKERVLKTIQQSIPRVVSDHKKNLELKDTEILELRNKFDSSETRNIELRGELARLKKESQLIQHQTDPRIMYGPSKIYLQ